MKNKLFLLIIVSLATLDGFAQETTESYMVARIKEEAYQHSKVMETLSYLSDVYGPRLSGSPAYYEAAMWAKQRLAKAGILRTYISTRMVKICADGKLSHIPLR